jgi:uncharacterized circularly permuted ATP-grasp superfamily protein
MTLSLPSDPPFPEVASALPREAPSPIDTGVAYDELFDRRGQPRNAAAMVGELLRELGTAELERRQRAARSDIRALGITFGTPGNGSAGEREWPFDIIPRVIAREEWTRLERGLKQRLLALNLFIDDAYNDQHVIRDGVFPEELLLSCPRFRRECLGMHPRLGIWAHVGGSDLVRDAVGVFHVLVDNLRIPSGVSYMLENRNLTRRAFPELFAQQRIAPVGGYVQALYDMLASLSPEPGDDPSIVVLTPGVFNSAYFEHCFLAQQMGVPLVEGQDLVVDSDDRAYVKTIAGLQRVHVIYRRVDDDSLDPEVFDADSLLGCRGLMRAWRRRQVAIVNAPGAGIADDKLVYSYVPKLIRYYLGEDPLIPNVYTYRLTDARARREVLDHLERFVVKPTGEAGGYGVMVGASATTAQLEECRRRVLRDPRGYVAQPIVTLSTAPTLCEAGIEPRHLDLRPFVLSGSRPYVTNGGLTRVALSSGSLIVNSSRGGGSKDTWVVEA